VWKEAVMAYSEALSGINLEGLTKTTKTSLSLRAEISNRDLRIRSWNVDTFDRDFRFSHYGNAATHTASKKKKGQVHLALRKLAG
jgi:hypothetical protein